MTEIRFRGEKNIIDIAKNLDAFRKVRAEYTETTKIGGTLSLLSRILIIYLIYNEISYYKESNLKFTFKPDVGLDDKIAMHVDLTIAMPCVGLSGVDLVDETQQDSFSYGTLKRESTYWTLPHEERLQFDQMQHINSFLREEYHSLADIMFKDILLKDSGNYIDLGPKTQPKVQLPFDACRLYGTFHINKVAGVLHLLAGDSPMFGLSDGHWHINDFRRVQSNFTHRINKFCFGDYSRKIIQPLEGDERYIPDESTVVQYFIKIVPTQIHNIFSTINTYQYSVTENFRTIDSHKNSYGSPGIYFKYDWSALKVIVHADRENVIQFAIRLCSVIAGIVVISGILNSVLQTLYREIVRLIAPQVFEKTMPIYKEQEQLLQDKNMVVQKMYVPNDLISNANKMAEDSLIVSAVPH